jgi:hypothetical protein
VSAPDFYNLIAVERGMPEGWRWCSVEGVGDDREHGGAMVTGAVPIGARKAGKNKGWPKWPPARKCNKVFITFAALDARMLQWERDEGKCSTCGGGGRQVAGISVVDGTTYRVCSRCKGSGKPPEAKP